MEEGVTKISWIRARVEEFNGDSQKVYSLYNEFLNETNSYWSYESYTRRVRECVNDFNSNTESYDPERVLKLEAQKQRLSDLNNEFKKTNRESFRLYNSLEEVFTEYTKLLSEVDLTKFSIKEHKSSNSGKIGILQISDNHLNELIYPSEAFGNSFDFIIASKRLKKFIIEAKKIFKMYNIKDVNIFFTGDMINSSRRLSEKLAQNTSLVRASLLATFLYQQIIIELTKDFNVSVANVVGNESRLDEFMDSSDILSSENWDYLIFNNLRLIFNKEKAVKFYDTKSNVQTVVQLQNGFNALLIHGHTFKSVNSIDREVGNILQNYAHNKIYIHGVFMGHYHSANISDFISRSSSLCGGNAYSTNDLMYLSRASQNIYIVNEDLGYHGIKIDLQYTDDIKGYDIEKELEKYNVSRNISNNEVIIRNLV